MKRTATFPILASTMLAIIAFEAVAAAPAGVLSNADEQRWIAAVKAHKTGDGRTVADVLSAVEKRSHGRFKVAGYDVMYDWKGQPAEVAIQYWIGSKRARDLVFSDLAYPMNRNGTIGKLSLTDRPTLGALEKGVEALQAEVDEHFRRDCPADATMRSESC